MKALSVKQPHASLIVYGNKRIENRTWEAPAYIIGQRIAIHASKLPDKEAMAELDYYEELSEIGPKPLPCGGIIGSAIVRDCKKFEWLQAREWPTQNGRDWWSQQIEWACGPWCWILADVRAEDQLVVCSGALGLWEVT
jgi:hypothetical protein